MAPDIAVNSLNQTVYFLRRVFEPSYKDDSRRDMSTTIPMSCGWILN